MSNIPIALTYNDVLLVPQHSKISSRSLVDIRTKITPKIEINFPVISINMDTITGIDMSVAMSEYGSLGLYPRFQAPSDQTKEVKKILDKGHSVIPAVGIKEDDLDRVKQLVNIGIQAVTVDVAHGHLEKCLNFVKRIKHEYKDLEVIAGVIATYKGARDLFEAGADAVRVGVGPGTICTTRYNTGVGIPQITAIMDAYKAGQEFNKPILADGGTKTSGDIIKALAAGANAVITGNQLAGTKETPGKIIKINGKKYKEYNASTSKTEKLKQYKRYSKNKSANYVDFIEGIESLVPYKGSVVNVLKAIETGIRSGLSYNGAFNIQELHKKRRFVRITSASINENGPHGVLERL